MNRAKSLLAVVALVEGATGLALMVAPVIVGQLLFGSDLDGAGVIVARVAGIVLFSFALTCGVAGRGGQPKAGLIGMLAYNLMVGAYFVFVGLAGAQVGVLLWPAAVLHVVVAAILVATLRNSQSEHST